MMATSMVEEWWQSKNHLWIRGNELLMGNTSLLELQSLEGSPLYVVNLGKVRENYRRIKTSFAANATEGVNTRVYYAMKANGSDAVLGGLIDEDLNVDTSAIGEVRKCLDLGIDPEKIIFTGTNFGLDGYDFLARSGVLINVDSMSQIKRLKDYAPLDISIRFNPGIGGIGFNSKFEMSGKSVLGSRLGIFEEDIYHAFDLAKSYGLNPIGLHQHVGSNWLKGDQLPHYIEAVEKLVSVFKKLQSNGHDLKRLNVGGGFGVRSHESYPEFPLDACFEQLWQIVKVSGIVLEEFAIEPGRFVVGNAGVMLATVNTVERKNRVDFVGVDVGFNAFHHKFLYQIENTIVNISRLNQPVDKEYAVVGYLGETGDVFCENQLLPQTEEGDVFLFYPAGAYCSSELAVHHYLPVPKEVFIS